MSEDATSVPPAEEVAAAVTESGDSNDETVTTSADTQTVPATVAEGASSSNTMTADPACLHYEGETCIYTDPATSTQYEWDAGSSQWKPRTGNSDYEWDEARKAWFPKVDADFLARYQMSYDYSDVEARRRQEALEAEKQAERDKAEAAAAAKKQAPVAAEPAWFEPDSAHNTKVYVSNLPLDVTEIELAEFMQKCGVLFKDPDNGRPKLKLYTEPGQPGEPPALKGDALCTYVKVESVALALTLLDGSDLRGKSVSVTRATFQMKGNYDPSLKPKKKRRKDKDKAKKQQESLFDWRPDRLRGERPKNERTVVVSNLFDPKQFEQDVSLILEFNQDLREECSKCGTVRKLVIYDRHPEGVATVTFEDPAEADICIKLLNLRWFGQRRITAQTWDGKTKYKVAETEAQAKERLSKWDSFLTSDEQKGASDGTENPTGSAGK